MPKPRIEAAIDIGTNTMLMLVGEVAADSGPDAASGLRTIVRTVEDHIDFVRLGQGVHANRRFAPEAMERTLSCFKKYRGICDKLGVTAVHAAATSASRDSSNAVEFYARVKAETGIEVKIIEGKTEARLSFLGGLLPSQDPLASALIDIGGGSTEFVALRAGEKAVHGQSLDIGSVRATEMFLEGDPYTGDSIRRMDRSLREIWTAIEPNLQQELREKEWVGIAGTPTTLAALALNLVQFDPEKVDGYRLELTHLQDMIRSLAVLKQEVRAANPIMGPGRADLMVAGGAILATAMEYFGKSHVTVSSRGLRHGVLLSPP